MTKPDLDIDRRLTKLNTELVAFKKEVQSEFMSINARLSAILDKLLDDNIQPMNYQLHVPTN